MSRRRPMPAFAIALAIALVACWPGPASPEPVPSETLAPSAAVTPPVVSGPPVAPSGSATVPPGQAANWTRIQPTGPAPEAREGHAWTVDTANAVAYLFGGRGTGGDLGDLWAYDMTADRWQRLEPAGPTPGPRSSAVAAWMDGVGLVVFGGRGSDADSDLWAYDPAANAWRMLAAGDAGPSPRAGACGALDPAGRLWVTHGETTDGTLLGDTWIYDPAASTWTAATAAPGGPAARAGAACWWSADRGFTLFGGRSADSDAHPDAWSRLDETAGSRWSTAALPTAGARHSAAVAASGSTVWLMGGQDAAGSLLADLVSYDLSTRATERFEATGEGPDGRLGAALVEDPEGERVLLFGGRSASGQTAELWSTPTP